MTGPATPRCPNCDAPAAGAWCASCGENLSPPQGALKRTLLRQYARIRHTLVALLFRPGLLTAEFRDGKRIRSIAPWRLAFNTVAFFFVLAFATDFHVAQFAQQDRSGTLAAQVQKAADRAKVDVATMSDRLDRRFNSIYTVLVVLTIGSYALLMRVTHWKRPRQRWSVHGVFALHLVAFIFIASAAYYLAGRVFALQLAPDLSNGALPAGAVVLFAVLMVIFVVYIAVALRRVYGDGRVAAALKALVVAAVGAIVDNVVLGLAFLLALKSV